MDTPNNESIKYLRARREERRAMKQPPMYSGGKIKFLVVDPMDDSFEPTTGDTIIISHLVKTDRRKGVGRCGEKPQLGQDKQSKGRSEEGSLQHLG